MFCLLYLLAYSVGVGIVGVGIVGVEIVGVGIVGYCSGSAAAPRVMPANSRSLRCEDAPAVTNERLGYRIRGWVIEAEVGL